jgi:hypothetical protein
VFARVSDFLIEKAQTFRHLYKAGSAENSVFAKEIVFAEETHRREHTEDAYLGELRRSTHSALAIDDSPLSEVIGRQLNSDSIAGDDADEVLPHPARDVGHDKVSALDFYAKPGVREGLRDDAFDFQGFFFLIRHTRVYCLPWTAAFGFADKTLPTAAPVIL